MRMRNSFSSLLKTERGNVVLIVAFALFTMTIAVGIAIEMSQEHVLRSKIASALDAAAIAAAGSLKVSGNCAIFTTPEDKQSCAASVAERYFNANFPKGYLSSKAITPTVSIDFQAGTITLTANTQQQTSFLSIIGVSSMPVALFSEVSLDIVGICSNTLFLCKSGSITNPTHTETTASWTCSGSTGVNAICNPQNPPLCSNSGGCNIGGTAGADTAGGITTWTCTSEGMLTHCSSAQPACGLTLYSCASGTLWGTGKDDGKNTQWTCMSNALTQDCSMPDPVCAQTLGNCVAGTASPVKDISGHYYWTCSLSGIDDNCHIADRAPIPSQR